MVEYGCISEQAAAHVRGHKLEDSHMHEHQTDVCGKCTSISGMPVATTVTSQAVLTNGKSIPVLTICLYSDVHEQPLVCSGKAGVHLSNLDDIKVELVLVSGQVQSQKTISPAEYCYWTTCPQRPAGSKGVNDCIMQCSSTQSDLPSTQMTPNRLLPKEVRFADVNGISVKGSAACNDHGIPGDCTMVDHLAISKLNGVSGQTETRNSKAGNVSKMRITDVQRSNESGWTLVEQTRR